MARFFNNLSTDSVIRADATAHEFDVTDSGAWACWCQVDAVGTVTRCPLMKKIGGSASNQGWGFQMSTAEVMSAMASDGTDQALAADSISMVAQTWYHFLGVLNRGDNTMKLYRDGTEVASADASLVGSTVTTRETRVGQDSATTPLNLWLGKIAHVMVWKRVAGNWTTQEIELLKMSRFGLPGLPQLLQLWWPLWGTTSPEPDWSGGNFHGTVNGTTREDSPPVYGLDWVTRRKSIFTAAAAGSGGRNLLLLDVG